MAKKEVDFELETNRIEALGDGIFAIVMTLLILEIRIPVVEGLHAGAELPAKLMEMWPKFLCYVISFMTLGVYWVAHHLHFATIKRSDRMLMWINILFYMVLGLVPFTTGMIGEYPHLPLPVVLYGVNMILISLVLYLHWIYATNRFRLIAADVSPHLIRTVRHVILMGPAVYMAAIALAFVNTYVSIAVYLLVNLLYIIPGGAHLILKHVPASPADESR